MSNGEQNYGSELKLIPGDRLYWKNNHQRLDGQLRLLSGDRVYAGTDAAQQDAKCAFKYVVNGEMVKGVMSGTIDEVRKIILGECRGRTVEFDFIEPVPEDMVHLFHAAGDVERMRMARMLLAGIEILRADARKQAEQMLEQTRVS